MREAEQRFADAIIRRDSAELERILAPDFTLRIADIPEGSLPRAIWLGNTLHRLKGDSAAITHLAARRLADDAAAVSLTFNQKGRMGDRDFSGAFYIVDFWKSSAGRWRIVARYSAPRGAPRERENRTPPPPADVDAQLTDTLSQLERQPGDIALRGFKDSTAIERLVDSTFTERYADAPDRSVPRSQWARSPSASTIQSLDERLHASRRLADDLAVVSLVQTQRAAREGQDRSDVLYVVDVWRRRSGHWKIIARYSSPQPR